MHLSFAMNDFVDVLRVSVMIVAEEYSKNVNTEAAEAVAQWLLSPAGQEMVVRGYMHSVLKGTDLLPYKSVSTDELIGKDLGVDWEKAYRERESINNLWTAKVTQ